MLETLGKRNVRFKYRENDSDHFFHTVRDGNVMVFALFFLFSDVSVKGRAGDVSGYSSKV